MKSQQGEETGRYGSRQGESVDPHPDTTVFNDQLAVCRCVHFR